MKSSGKQNKRRTAPHPDALTRKGGPDPGSATFPPPPAARPLAGLSSRRQWVFRFLAFALVPVLFLLMAEVGLRLSGYGYATGFYIKGQRAGREVRIENQKFGWRFFPPEAARTPRRTILETTKAPGTLRVFILGESAALGDPEPDFGFGRILQVLLEDRFDGVRFEVVNAAMTAINSHAILPIARDCARQAGDFWVLYLGNNEVVGPYGAGTVFGTQTPPLSLIRANLFLKSTCLGQALEKARQQWLRPARPVKTWGGMEMFVDHQIRADDARMPRVYTHFEKNLRDILQVARRAGVTVILSTVASNLKDCAPFGSLPRVGLTDESRRQFDAAYQAGIAREQAGQFAEALAQYSAAAKIDDHFADLLYRLGRCHLALNQHPEARRFFVEARDQDTLRFRADSRLNQIITRLATNQPGTFGIDGESLLSAPGSAEVPGNEFLLEHVHLNFAGNYQLALAVARQVAAHLPESARRTVTERPVWLSQEECAQRLAWTIWDQFEVMDTLRKRIELPPFTRQINHQERYQKIAAEAARLERSLDTNAMAQAVQIYQAAMERYPQDWALRFRLGRLRQRLGDVSGAIAAYDRVIELLPHHEEAYYHRGSALDQAGRREEAIASFHEAIRWQPRFPEAYSGLGLTLANQGRYEAAIEQYQKALELKPDFAAAHINLGQALSRLGRTEEAKQHYGIALKLKPDSTAAHVNLGKILNSEGQLSAAVSNYQSALHLDPSNALIHFNLGNALVKLGQTQAGQRHYAEAVRLKPDFSEAHSNLGFELARQGQDAEAMIQFAEAVRLDPNNAEAHLNLGVAFAKQQKMEEAIQHFEAALRTDPTYTTAQRYLEAARKRRPNN